MKWAMKGRERVFNDTVYTMWNTYGYIERRAWPK